MTTKLVEISQPFDGKNGTMLYTPRAGTIEPMLTMVLESVGPMRHAVSVPFHDSQARGKAILIRTGWDQKWGTESYGEPGPFLHEDLVFRLIRSNVKLVGVDFGAIDADSRLQLQAKGIAILENLRDLNTIPKWGFTLRIENLGDGSPGIQAVRVFGEIPSPSGRGRPKGG
jgi:kynurenine formamidase